MKGFWKGLMIGPLLLVISYLGLAYVGGLPPFYYLEYNRLEANLESIEGVEILDNWQHHDISLEDCGFTVKSAGSEAVSFDFYDVDDWNAPFDHLDGVLFTFPNFPGTNERFGRVCLDREGLKAAGVEEINLKGVLRNLKGVLTAVRGEEHLLEVPKLEGEWIVIRYDLERYENGGPNSTGGDPGPVGEIVRMSREDRDFLGYVEADWKKHSLSEQSAEAKALDQLGVKVTIPNLARGWVFPDLYGGALASAAPLSRDGLVRVGPQVALVKVNRNLVKIYREREGTLTCETWKNED